MPNVRALSANGPHIRFLEELNIRFIINVTPDGNSFLFKWLEGIDMEEHTVTPVDGSKWTFRFANGVPLNDANVTHRKVRPFNTLKNQGY